MRETIRRSWLRSRMCGLDPGSPLDLPYEPDLNLDSRLARSARPVLDYLAGILPGCGTAAVLLDSRARLLIRICDDASLARRLDSGTSVPGFVWSEEHAGANAVGIALEERVPAWTSGADHYLEALRDLACAAVPIVNPVTQRLEGVLDVTTNLSNASPLMLPVALQAARTIEQRLVDAATTSEHALLERFLTASRRRGSIVLVVSDRTELSTPSASRLLSNDDRAALTNAAESCPDGVRKFTLGTGAQMQATFESVTANGTTSGTIVTLERVDRRPGRFRTDSPRTVSPEQFAGRSPIAAHVREEAAKTTGATYPLVITGEHGTGRSHLARIIGQEFDRTVLLDAGSQSSQAVTALVREIQALVQHPRICVIVRNAHALPSDGVAEIARLGRRAEESESRLIATSVLCGVDALPSFIGLRIHLPPLRERPEDILDLVPMLIARRNRRPIRASTELIEVLMRYDWPGNVNELDVVLDGMLHADGASELLPSSLPVQYRRGNRRMRRIEHMERNAITQALVESHGNKSRAAEILGIGRATLYRKIRSYGLSTEVTRS